MPLGRIDVRNENGIGFGKSWAGEGCLELTLRFREFR